MIGSKLGLSSPHPSAGTPLLRPGDRVGLVACSDGLTSRDWAELVDLRAVAVHLGLELVESPHLFAPDLALAGGSVRLAHDHLHSAPDEERARALEDMFFDPSVKAIFDVSGGDLAGGVLTHLDFELIAANPKPFFGYSDLTVVLNALQPITPVYLWTVRNLVRSDAATQLERFAASVMGTAPDLFALNLTAIQGELPVAPVVGGNLRCLLKLAGTGRFPQTAGRVLALESHGASSSGVYAGLHQLRQMGVFDDLAGVVLGTFTALEVSSGTGAPARVLFDALSGHPGCRALPVARADFGHGANSKAISLGTPLPQ